MEGELHFNVLFACILEGNSELVLTSCILNSKWDQCSVGSFAVLEDWHVWCDLLHANHLWDLNLASEENFQPLHLSDLLPIFKEILHASFEFGLKKFLEALTHAESLVCISQETDIDL